MQNEYGANSPLVKKVLKGKTPEARAAELIDGTKLKDVAIASRSPPLASRMTNSGDDPMIELAKDIDKEARAVRKRYEEEVVAVERGNYAKIARALFEEQGTKLYPDATFTLRLSYGAVKGYRGKRQVCAAVHDARRTLRAFEPIQSRVSLQPAAALDQQASVRQPAHAVQFRFHQRHHRRQQRLADD